MLPFFCLYLLVGLVTTGVLTWQDTMQRYQQYLEQTVETRSDLARNKLLLNSVAAQPKETLQLLIKEAEKALVSCKETAFQTWEIKFREGVFWPLTLFVLLCVELQKLFESKWLREKILKVVVGRDID